MQPEITILELSSRTTGRRFFSVEFSGDTDMVTDGWISLTSIDRLDIVITNVTSEEHQASDGFLWCEHRINRELNRSDLRAVWLERAGAGGDLFYRDIFDSKGEAMLVLKISAADFEKIRGKITYHGVI